MIELEIARDAIGNLEKKVKKLLYENMDLKEENTRLSEIAG